MQNAAMKESPEKPNFSAVGTEGPIQRAFEEVHKTLKDQTTHFDKRLNTLQEGFARLNNAVVGDESMGQEGIVKRLLHLEFTQNQHTDKFKILPVLWKIGATCAAATVAFIAWAWDKITLHLK